MRLLACPAALRATHQYVPASPPPLPLRPPPRLCVTRRKKSAPSGRTSRCPRGSNASPSRYQVTSGGGIPSKAQRRVAGSLRKTVTFVGSSIIRGGTRTPPPPPLPLLPAISRRNEKKKERKIQFIMYSGHWRARVSQPTDKPRASPSSIQLGRHSSACCHLHVKLASFSADEVVSKAHTAARKKTRIKMLT